MAVASTFLLIDVTVRYVPTWFPGAEFKKFAETGKKYCTEILEGPFKNTKESWVSVIVLSVSLCSLISKHIYFVALWQRCGLLCYATIRRIRRVRYS